MDHAHAEAILRAVNEFFENGTEVHPGALLFEDERTLAEHVAAALNDEPLYQCPNPEACSLAGNPSHLKCNPDPALLQLIREGRA